MSQLTHPFLTPMSLQHLFRFFKWSLPLVSHTSLYESEFNLFWSSHKNNALVTQYGKLFGGKSKRLAFFKSVIGSLRQSSLEFHNGREQFHVFALQTYSRLNPWLNLKPEVAFLKKNHFKSLLKLSEIIFNTFKGFPDMCKTAATINV